MPASELSLNLSFCTQDGEKQQADFKNASEDNCSETFRRNKPSVCLLGNKNHVQVNRIQPWSVHKKNHLKIKISPKDQLKEK